MAPTVGIERSLVIDPEGELQVPGPWQLYVAGLGRYGEMLPIPAGRLGLRSPDREPRSLCLAMAAGVRHAGDQALGLAQPGNVLGAKARKENSARW